MAEDIDQERIADGTPDGPSGFPEGGGIYRSGGRGRGSGARQVRPRPDQRRAGADAGSTGSRRPPWWPSKWGAADEAGSSNQITPAKVLDAAKWIQRRQDLQDRPHLRAGHAAVRRARLLAAYPGQADRRPVRHEQARLPRRVPRHRDRPGRDAVRRPRPHRLQLGKDGDMTEMRFYNGLTERRDRRRLRPEEARHREAEAALHPRRIWSTSRP